jgi:hypothetical protein
LSIEATRPSSFFTRYSHGVRYLGIEKEQRLEQLMRKLRQMCENKRILVKPFFDDAGEIGR